jgi:hypothetical protein
VWLLITGVWLLSNVLLVIRWSGWLSTLALILLGVIVPGVLMALWLLADELPALLEGVVYAGGLGFALYVLTLLGLTILPGALQGWHVLVALNLVVLLLAGLVWRSWHRLRVLPPPARAVPPAWAWLGLVSVLVMGALLRLPNLGYSEFLYDEIRIVHRAAEILQGYESALLLHRKGPAEILIPTGIYSATLRLNEFDARLPFALANLAGLLGVYLIGRRLVGEVAGWSAAMLLALDGFFIGFSRFAQYQSIVLLMSVLIVLALARQAASPRPLSGSLWAAGLAFVVGLFAHYEQVWVIFPGLYLLGVYLRRTGDWRGLVRAAAAPVLVSLALALAFFVPFLLDARWASTANNIFGKRIGDAFPYNNLVDFFERATIYTSAYQALAMVAGAFAAYAVTVWRGWPRAVALPAIFLGAAGGLAIFFRPHLVVLGETDHTWLFFALLFGLALFAPRAQSSVTVAGELSRGDAGRTLWLWFAVPMIGSIFFVNEPNTHVYGFYLGWALVVGIAVEAGWGWLRAHTALPAVRAIGAAAAGLVVVIFGAYTFQMFTQTRVEVLRTWTENRPWGYWTPYPIPRRDSLYGFPYKNGWKVIGALYADGTLDAPYDANETGLMGDWYARGPYFCPPDAEYYLLPNKLEPFEQGEYVERLAELEALGYHEWGTVTVNDDPRLRIFTTRPVAGPPRVFAEEEYGPIFDAQLMSPFFIKPGPALLTAPAVTVDYRFGDLFALKGYTLPTSDVAPGDKLRLDLFWATNRMVELEDKTFVQIINLETLHKAAQRDAEPGCTKYSMDDWRPGDLNLDPYTLTIAPDAPPGRYTVLVGMYHADTEARYPISTPDGTFVGDALALTTIEVR